MRPAFLFFLFLLIASASEAQKKRPGTETVKTSLDAYDTSYYNGLKWRNIGPFRGGRSLAVMGVPGDALTYYAGTVGGRVWKTKDGGNTWDEVSDTAFHSS